MFPTKHKAQSAFSLIELLVVLGIIAIISVFAVPAANTIVRGSQLTQASQLLSDQIALARQTAITKNRSIEVRFYRYGDPEQPGEEANKPESGKFRAIQLFEVLETGTPIAAGKIHRLPSTVILNDDTLSTLISAKGESNTLAPKDPGEIDPELPGEVKRKYQYVSFRFRPDGSTDLLPTGNWYATLHAITDVIKESTPPPNFFTIQIDPVSGTTKAYRPTAG